MHKRMGGFLGIKDSASVTEISVPMKNFNLGDTIKVNLDFKNKECKKDIERYKVKLEGHYGYSAGSEG